MEIINDTVHCKVLYNNEYRRFVFTGSEFSELHYQIKQLLSLPSDLFVIKYEDDEGDMITMSSDLELKWGLSFANGKVLRLQVDSPGIHRRNSCPNRPNGLVQHPILHGKCVIRGFKKQPKCNIRHRSDSNEILKKRDLLQAIRSQFSNRELTPEELDIKCKLDGLVGNINEKLNEERKPEEKTETVRVRKLLKSERKMCKKFEEMELEKKSREGEEVAAMKAKIQMIQPRIKQIKSAVRLKKQVLNQLQNNKDIAQTSKEIYDLKRELIMLTQELCPLKLRLRFLEVSKKCK